MALWTYSGRKHSDAASRCSRRVVTGTNSVVCSHHAREVSPLSHDSRWRQAWKRLRPSGRCVRAAKWRSICGDWPVLRGRLAQLTHTLLAGQGGGKQSNVGQDGRPVEAAFGNVPAHVTQ